MEKLEIVVLDVAVLWLRVDSTYWQHQHERGGLQPISEVALLPSRIPIACWGSMGLVRHNITAGEESRSPVERCWLGDAFLESCL